MASIRSGIGENMEDRYLFKGKEKDSGKWLEWNAIAGIPHNVTILTNTICQCTGLKDKNGKLIWENDIAKFDVYYYEKLQSSTISQIKWCNALCALSLVVNDRGTRGTLGHLMDSNKEIEVIGNIFDNPELLESEG